MPVILACDLGGTHFRAALVDQDGAILAEDSRPAPAHHDHGAHSEIDPDAWWQCLIAAAARLHAIDPAACARIEGIAMCGITRTQVLVDRHGEAIRLAITWKDTRAAGTIDALRARLPAAHPETAEINAFHPLARLDWLSQHEPQTMARLHAVLDPKDFLNLRLTGAFASDPVSSARLVACNQLSDGKTLLSAAGLPPDLLPVLREPWEPVGHLCTGLPMPFSHLAGLPVFTLSNDTWAAVVGLGAMQAGQAYNISGTTEVFGAVGLEPVEAQGLLRVDWRGLWQIGGPGQNGADTLAWLFGLLGNPERVPQVGDWLAELANRPRHPERPLFLPFLSGERVPYWDADLRGAFVGLNRAHQAHDLVFALLEGIGFLNRVVLERAEAALGAPVSAIRFGGGASQSPHWRQIKADILDRPVIAGEAQEPGLIGAAATALFGLGHFASLTAAQAAMVRTGAPTLPTPATRAHYDSHFALWCEAHQALAPVSRGLAALGRVQAAADRGNRRLH